jgi:hypothetical protein
MLPRILRSAFASLALLAPACGDDGGPVLTPDSGRIDAGPMDAGPGDVTSPRVLSSDPADGAIGVERDAAIEIVFSEAVMGDDVALRVNDEPAAATVVVEAAGDRVRIEPAEAFPPGAAVRVEVGSGITDLAGNTLSFPYAFAFEVLDDMAPVITSSSPVEGATDISSRHAEIALVFSKPMNATAGTLLLSGGDGVLGPLVWTSGTQAHATVEGLENSVAYRVALTGFADTAGNALDPSAYLGDGVLDFTTRDDDEPPSVVDSSPAEGQVNVSLRSTAEIVVRFDEPMDRAVTSADLTTPARTRALAGVWNAEGTEIRFAATGQLSSDAPHALDLRAFRDAVGNALDAAPYLGDGRLEFRTGSDEAPPRVLYSSPEEGSSDATYRTNEIVVVFDKAMDTSVTTIPVSNGVETFDAALSWNLSGTQFIVDVIDRMFAGRVYRIDLSGLEDATGIALDRTDEYLVDGALDFTLAFPTGEMCRDALTIAQATSPGLGVFEWRLAPTAARTFDGSASCDDSGIEADAVIAYTKTTASASAGGTVLRIRADSPSTAGLDVDVYAGICDPTLPSATRLKCLWNNRTWEAYLDVGPGDYFVWVSRNTGAFEGATVVIEEVALPPQGESCLAPHDTTSAIYTPPATAGDPQVWTIPSDAVFSYDMDVTWGGAGSMECDSDFAGGPIHGNDAVIRLTKTSATSTLFVTLSNASSSQGVNLEILDACDPVAAPTSLDCRHNVRSGTSPYEASIEGPAGDYYAWIASDTTSMRFPGATLSAREIEPLPGSSCSRAIPITVGPGPTTVPVTPDVPQRFDPPSCAADSENFTWYRLSTAENATIVTANAMGTIAMFSATDDRELACRAGTVAVAPQPVFLPAGRDVCIALASGSAITSLAIEPVPYGGVLGVPTDLGILRPLTTTGTERSITSMNWMTVTPTTIYAGISSTGVLVAPRGGGTRADFHEDVGSAELGNGGVSAGESVFSLDDTSTASATHLFRFVDPLGTWGPTPWDTGTAWPTDSFDSIAYDGTSLFVVNDWATAVPTRFYSFSPSSAGAGTLLGSHPTLRNVVALAADSTYFYVQAQDGSVTTTEGIYRVSRATPSSAALLTLIPVDSTRAALALDSLTSPAHLYARDDAGDVHVIVDPAGPSPRHLGVLSTLGDSSDWAMAFDHAAGALVLFESETVTTGRFVRLD